MNAVAPAWRRGARQDEPEWVVLATVAVALLLGLLLQLATLGQTETATASNVRLDYPATWVTGGERGALLSVADTAHGGPFGASASVRQVARTDLVTDADATVYDAAIAWSLNDQVVQEGFRVVDVRQSSVNGREAAEVEYVYLSTGQTGLTGAGGGIPRLMRAIDTVVASGDSYYVLTFVAPADEFDRLTTAQFPRFSSTFDSLRNGWQTP